MKRRAIFRKLHTRKLSIAFLQETYSSKAQENMWRAEWGGKIYFNHGSKHSKGVAILFDPKLTVTVKKEIKSDDGRIIILETNIDDKISVLVNIYVYAPDNIHAQQMFFKNLSEMLRNYANSFTFIGGDFNCPMSNEDKKGGQGLSSKKNFITRIKQLMGLFIKFTPYE